MTNEKYEDEIMWSLFLDTMGKEEFTIISINKLITKYYCNIL
jgi:hypothetical protein